MTMNFSQVNFDAMTGPQLVENYNEMAKTLGRDPVKKFENKVKAVARCEMLRAILTDVITDVAPKKSVAISKASVETPPKTVKAIVAGLKERHVKRPSSTKIGGPKIQATKSAERDARVIVILTKGEANPRREGTDAHRHFECMRGAVTVAKYLDEFDADRRKVARHWLYNTVKDGYVEVK